MKSYLLSLAAGLLVGLIYSFIGVRSPAPPVIALLGLFGMLLGEQILPVAKWMIEGRPAVSIIQTRCAAHVLGRLPSTEAAERPVKPIG